MVGSIPGVGGRRIILTLMGSVMKTEVMIWTESGVWLQTYDREGRMHLSGCGRLSLTSVQGFCEEHGLDLIVKGPGRDDRRLSYGWRRELSPVAREELAIRGF